MTQPPESPRDPSEGAAPDEPRAPWAAPEQPPARAPPPSGVAAAPEQTSAPGASTEGRRAAPAGDWTQTAPRSGRRLPDSPRPAVATAAGPTGRTRSVADPTGPGAVGAADRTVGTATGHMVEPSPPPQGPWAQATPGQGNWNQPPQAGQPGWEQLGPPLPPTKARRRGRAAARGHRRRGGTDRWRHGHLPGRVRHAVRIQGRGVRAGSRLIARLRPQQVRHPRHPRPPGSQGNVPACSIRSRSRSARPSDCTSSRPARTRDIWPAST